MQQLNSDVSCRFVKYIQSRERELLSVAFSFDSFARHNDNLNVKYVLLRERAKKQKKKGQ